MNVLDGTVIGQCMQRHRHQEFIRFLNRLERDIPAGKLVHVVLDNYGSQPFIPSARICADLHNAAYGAWRPRTVPRLPYHLPTALVDNCPHIVAGAVAPHPSIKNGPDRVETLRRVAFDGIRSRRAVAIFGAA
jgi:hypothetical protein